MSGGSPRALRVAQLIQEEISRLLLRGLKDPRLGGLITITGAKVSPDLKEAVVYYSVFGGEAQHKDTAAGLAAAARHLQHEIARNLKLRYAPHLRFVFDESIEHGDRIEQLLKEAKSKPPAENDLPESDLEGVLVVDKPGGLTSSAVVQRVKRLLRVDKVGHTGTLDPMATGVLPLCLGQATALAQILTGQDKRYRARLRLGIATDSGDAEGKVIAERPVPPIERAAVEAEMRLMLGAQRQVPPMVSAVRVGGQRLYEMARKGIAIEREARAIEIRALELKELSLPELVFEVHCSKGTYVRVLAEDLAVRLGTVGHLTALRRLASGRFALEQAIELAALERAPEKAAVIPMADALGEMPRAVLDDAEARALAYGKRPPRSFPGPLGWVALMGSTGALLALAERDAEGALVLKRVFVKPPGIPPLPQRGRR